MNDREGDFRARFPTLFAILVGDFTDNDPPDEEQARKILQNDWGDSGTIPALVRESRLLLETMDHEWETFSDIANRDFRGPAEARDWLLGLLKIWEEGA